MSEDRLLEMMYSIIDDRRYIEHDGRVLVFRSLTPAEKNYSNFLYKVRLRECLRHKLLSEKQIIKEAIKRGDWDPKKEALCKLYKMEIERLEEDIKSIYKLNKGKKNKARMDIIRRRKDIEAIEAERIALLQNSAEYTARVAQNTYIISRVALNEDGGQIWPTYADFENEDDANTINFVLKAWSAMHQPTEAEIRAIARSPTWHVIWSSSKQNGNKIFDKETTAEYSNEQLLLCYWSMMYDSVYESMERPPQHIVEDDEALDKWFEDQKEEREKQSKRKNLKHRTSAVDKHPEVFVMASTDEEADDIYSMNSKLSLAQIRNEVKKLKAKEGQPVKELELRYDRIKLELLAQQDTKHLARVRKERARPRFIGGA